MWMCLEEGEVVVRGGRREGFWAVVEARLYDGREGRMWMGRGGMMTCSFLFV